MGKASHTGSHKGHLFIISGPSGVGKSTVLSAILERNPHLRYSVSYTTRRPRGKEQDGVDYHFISEMAFREKIAASELAEWAEVHGHLYGTSGRYIEKSLSQGLDVLLDIDVEGAKILSSKYPAGFCVFIAPPSMEELERRMKRRDTDAPEVVGRRLKNAQKEMAQAHLYDRVVVNDDVAKTVSELEEIIDTIDSRN
ncbi:MAG: guanylate kinase [Thermodesulfobacteriota bacterium]|nr:guanylate kinase [Thermodesulfobacteriota bacterium]